MDGLFLLGRIIFGGYFLYSGLNHFFSHAALTQYAASKSVPAPDLAVMVAGLLILVGGASVLVGAWPEVGVLCILTFLAGVSPMMHNFWSMPDPQQMAEMVNFTKNMALMGGTFITFGVPHPWPYSIEGRLRGFPV